MAFNFSNPFTGSKAKAVGGGVKSGFNGVVGWGKGIGKETGGALKGFKDNTPKGRTWSVAKKVGKGGGFYGIGAGAGELIGDDNGGVRDYTGSAAKGAAWGAGIGSVIPGFGTAIGAGIGAAGGLLFEKLDDDDGRDGKDDKADDDKGGAGGTIWGGTAGGVGGFPARTWGSQAPAGYSKNALLEQAYASLDDDIVAARRDIDADYAARVAEVQNRYQYVDKWSPDELARRDWELADLEARRVGAHKTISTAYGAALADSDKLVEAQKAQTVTDVDAMARLYDTAAAQVRNDNATVGNTEAAMLAGLTPESVSTAALDATTLAGANAQASTQELGNIASSTAEFLRQSTATEQAGQLTNATTMADQARAEAQKAWADRVFERQMAERDEMQAAYDRLYEMKVAREDQVAGEGRNAKFGYLSAEADRFDQAMGRQYDWQQREQQDIAEYERSKAGWLMENGGGAADPMTTPIGTALIAATAKEPMRPIAIDKSTVHVDMNALSSKVIGTLRGAGSPQKQQEALMALWGSENLNDAEKKVLSDLGITPFAG